MYVTYSETTTIYLILDILNTRLYIGNITFEICSKMYLSNNSMSTMEDLKLILYTSKQSLMQNALIVSEPLFFF